MLELEPSARMLMGRGGSSNHARQQETSDDNNNNKGDTIYKLLPAFIELIDQSKPGWIALGSLAGVRSTKLFEP